jgi:demethylmenaquinone methyltransferase / 2-methoxy-6-polyprenyl-1,4-benzoquinol methylase
MFDAIAERYDFLNHLLSAGLDKQWRKSAVQALQLTGHEVVLDLCTGTADLALAAIMKERGARRVVGVDFSGAMLEIGKRKVAAASSRVDLVRGDATRIPLRDAAVDATTIGFGIRNVEAPAEACREIARVLRPGGTLVILEFSLPRSPRFAISTCGISGMFCRSSDASCRDIPAPTRTFPHLLRPSRHPKSFCSSFGTRDLAPCVQCP